MELTEKEERARERLCLPLDGLNTLEDVSRRIEELSPFVGIFKIGLESYTRFGPEVIRLIQGHGSEVFYDSKYHDIPNTVRGAARAASDLGVYMFNVHATGGSAMMKAAVDGARESAGQSGKRIPKIIGVTVMTSIDRHILNEEIGMEGEVESHVLRLARLAEGSGLDGIVCSAADLPSIRGELPANFMFVTPGIKGPNTPAGADQRRVVTPGEAIGNGSSILVIGRAITAGKTNEERIRSAREVLADMAAHL